MKILKILFFSIILTFINLFAQEFKVSWGWEAHRYINENAVDYLPSEMSFFRDHRNYLRDHSIDPDTDPLPGYFHYIDIDYYPEFFTHTLPHNLDSLAARYNISLVQNNGIVPWVVAKWTDSLSTSMAAGKWVDVWQIAAELGHYVADSHQPLHLTVNYNGQETDNYGIHQRYETNLINLHLSELNLPASNSIYWPNVIESVFSYVDEIYPYVDSILIADDFASAQDPAYNTTYYNIMWQRLENLTSIFLNKAILDLASLWKTAWENAGHPLPVGLESYNQNPEVFSLAKAYPNPFNASTIIQFSFHNRGFVTLKIYSMLGNEVTTLVSEKLAPGMYKYKWDASGFSSGVYFYRLAISPSTGSGNGISQTKKLILLK